MTVGVRGRNDMLIWFDGYLPGGITPRVEFEWSEVYLSVAESCAPMPEDFHIEAYPNPFHSAVRISFCQAETPDLPVGQASASVIEIFDIGGRIIAQIPLNKWGTERSEAGGVIVWQPDESVGSGVYLIRAEKGGRTYCKPVVYIK